MDVKEIDILGESIDRHWYYRAKAAALLRALDGQAVTEIVDVGAGSGFFSRTLLAATAARRAVCIDPAYERERVEHQGDKTVAFRRGLDGRAGDLFLFMDVLEHVDDELALLAPYVRAAPPDALFVVSVPAFQFLWSGHDVFLEHRRRYTRRALTARVQQSGLEPVSSCYFFAAVFPLAAAIRLAGRLAGPLSGTEPRSQLRPAGRLTNAALYGLCAAELPLMKHNRLFGLSVFALFRKPRGAPASGSRGFPPEPKMP